MKNLAILLLPSLLLAEEPVMVLLDGDTVELDSAFARLNPDSSDFVFEPPESWGENLAPLAAVMVDSAAFQPGIEALTDGDPWTAWSSRPGNEKPVIELSFEQPVKFNRLVTFNRHTKAWGTGGGANAAKHTRLLVDQVDPDAKACIRELDLTCPKFTCVERVNGATRFCFFTRNPEPDVFELPLLRTSHLTLEVTETCVQNVGREDHPDEVNCALSEVMMFYAPPQDS